MKTIRQLLVVGLLSLVLMAENATAGQGNRGRLSFSDYKFASAALLGASFEVQAGDIANAKAWAPQVRQFADVIVRDHTQAAFELGAIAMNNGATLDGELPPRDGRPLNRLQRLAGTEFDRAFVALMIDSHQHELRDLQRLTQRLHDSDLKRFALKAAATLSEHLEQAHELQLLWQR